jgi:predicted transcriptional regulator YdeE
MFAILAYVFTGELSSANDQRPATRDKEEAAIIRKEISGFTVIGIAARTDNARESSPDAVIPKQWQKFFGERLPQKIPGKTGPELYAVYTDYSGDHNGEYTYVIGASVKDESAPATGMVLKRIPPGEYAVFTTGKGPFAKIVPAAWQQIWKLEEAGKLKRTYQADFELYDQRAQDPQNAQLDIYVGIKK